MERIRELLNTSYAHKRGYTGKGITVAVMDTGLFLHKDLRGRVKGFYDVLGNETECYDDNGHGTHVAGIIAASGNNGKGIAGDNIWEWHRDVAFCRLKY